LRGEAPDSTARPAPVHGFAPARFNSGLTFLPAALTPRDPLDSVGSMLRAVTFDLWETLIHEDATLEAPRRAHRVKEISAIVARHGFSPSAEAWEKAHRDVLVRMDAYWSATLDTSVVEQAKFFIELAVGRAIDGKIPGGALLECAKHYGEAALKHPPLVAEGARSVLQVARACGLRLGLICNTGRTPGKVLRDLLKQFAMVDCFDSLFFSDEGRLRKPAKDVFLKSLQRLGAEPAESIHVGDQPDTDLAGARASGMKSVYLKREGGPDAEADYVISAIGELPAILGKLTEGPRGGRTGRAGDETVITG
jgi:putative hydrolase of the HAD superfamily